jgi:hypothetical protein
MVTEAPWRANHYAPLGAFGAAALPKLIDHLVPLIERGQREGSIRADLPNPLLHVGRLSIATTTVLTDPSPDRVDRRDRHTARLLSSARRAAAHRVVMDTPAAPQGRLTSAPRPDERMACRGRPSLLSPAALGA